MDSSNTRPDVMNAGKGYFFRIWPIIAFLGITIIEICFLNFNLHTSDAFQYIAVATYIIHVLSGGLILLVASGIIDLMRNKQKGWVIAYYVFLGQAVISGLALSVLGLIIFLFIGGYTELVFRKTYAGVKLHDVAMNKEAKNDEKL